ncbi:ADR205Cp [Eremothecium gossypii ATCC 10895]|uniref:ADR205Cp n=1 Tax=Eremothecium gossypii (strain ATCC 10895 / CBS 109.51 / FGSC 9923 / NRRL Y-1056) TaxID=284811 RepID=Q759R8_EREGS|nr:ADR205Cp [Eremothecium gossypii ATCC 10895]AAS52125.2 ADR205Cp [Eremothecium gossypii ATCC 10895]
MSIDDVVLVKQNLTLLDNATDLDRPAVDYFRCSLAEEPRKVFEIWQSLVKMGKRRLLRLPSCAMEDQYGYELYVQRLQHCLWRRWSMRQFGLEHNKIDPLQINWNKENDVTLLYGPTMSADACRMRPWCRCGAKMWAGDCDAQVSDSDSDAWSGMTSAGSSASSILECRHRRQSRGGHRGLHFNEHVQQRNIDWFGGCHDRFTVLNDRWNEERRASAPECIIVDSVDDTEYAAGCLVHRAYDDYLM